MRKKTHNHMGRVYKAVLVNTTTYLGIIRER